MNPNRRLALLIDGDNAQASLLALMLAEASKYGVITIRRVYGDWTEQNMKSWKEEMHTYALQPIQQFRYTQGKNATDSALIIDAMDILYTAGVDGICIVSSDSDYTRLATRIREKNLFVLGIGRSNTPRSFVNGCDVFVYTENLVTLPPTKEAQKTATTTKTKQADKNKADARLEELFRRAFDLAVSDDGWAHLGSLGSSLGKLDPAFDSRTYGSQLVKAYPSFIEVDKSRSSSGSIYVRPKEKAKPKTKSFGSPPSASD
jgi:uncharacterized LabA/DUF88 family protein